MAVLVVAVAEVVAVMGVAVLAVVEVVVVVSSQDDSQLIDSSISAENEKA